MYKIFALKLKMYLFYIGYYPPPPMSNYDPYNMPVDMRSRGYHRGYSRRPTRGLPMGSSYRPDYRNGGNYLK